MSFHSFASSVAKLPLAVLCIHSLTCVAGLYAAEIPKLPLSIVLSAPNAAPGAIAQIRLTLAAPHRISSGSIVIDLDPAVFGPVIAVDAFSATGDQSGHATVTNNHVVADFYSPSGGIGALPEVPAVAITVPVLSAVPNGAAASISFLPGGLAWNDAYGNVYKPAAQPVRFQMDGKFSIGSVTPGGAQQPAGTKIVIGGLGFTAASQVRIDGVPIASMTVISPQEIDVILAAAADITGKRVMVQNPDGTQADFFPALRATSTTSDNPDLRFIFPQQLFLNSSSESELALQNQTQNPVEVVLYEKPVICTKNNCFPPTPTPATLAPGQILECSGGTGCSGATSTIPIRMLSDLLPTSVSESGLDPLAIDWLSPPAFCGAASIYDPDARRCWLALQGTPQAAPILEVSNSRSVPFSITISSEGGNWLTASPARGTACLVCAGNQITLNADPPLAPGSYHATVTATPDDPTLSPATFSFTYRVATSIVSFADPPPYLYFVADATDPPPPPVTLRVTATQDGTPFTVRLDSYLSNEKWLLVSPMQGVTPATLYVTVDPSVHVASSVSVVVSGPSNSANVIVGMTRFTKPVPSASPGSLTFWALADSGAPVSQDLNVGPFAYMFQVTPLSASPWLTVGPDSGSGVRVVTANPKGLPAGTYLGALNLSYSNSANTPPIRVPVTFVVWNKAPPLTITPDAITLTATSGTFPRTGAQFNVSSGGIPIDFAASISTEDGNPWLSLPGFVNNINGFAPYGSAFAAGNAQGLPPGSYHGTIAITAPVGSTNTANVLVTFNVTPATPVAPTSGPPLAGSIVNAASLAAGSISPGELLTIFGLNAGPASPANLSLDANGKVATNLAGLHVSFDGVPAPVLYASSAQTNVVAPYQIAGETVTSVVVEYNGQRSITGLPVAASSPGIFRDNLNDPAGRGSVLHLLATGLGQTAPAGITGQIAPDNSTKPSLPVSLTIGGLNAVVLGVSSVPNLVSGVFQIDVVVPSAVAPGSAVPVVLTVGAAQSPAVTIAVN